jgi:excisionase family DNA binding protein
VEVPGLSCFFFYFFIIVFIVMITVLPLLGWRSFAGGPVRQRPPRQTNHRHFSSDAGRVVPMEVSVAEAADILEVSPRRVRQLIDAGRVQARQVGGQWLVEAASLPSGPHRARPMAADVAWAVLADLAPEHYAPQDAYRWRQRRNRLVHDPEPERLLASWVASRGRRLLFESRASAGLLEDDRVVPSGLSDPRSEIAAGDVVEGYVRDSELDAVRRQYLLRPGGHGSRVVLHIADELPQRPVPPLVLAADLAEHDEPRALNRARELILETLMEAPA